jgi:hypothetical protein
MLPDKFNHLSGKPEDDFLNFNALVTHYIITKSTRKLLTNMFF